jgi:hypothetical protein
MFYNEFSIQVFGFSFRFSALYNTCQFQINNLKINNDNTTRLSEEFINLEIKLLMAIAR